jgi:hypothetical protein
MPNSPGLLGLSRAPLGRSASLDCFVLGREGRSNGDTSVEPRGEGVVGHERGGIHVDDPLRRASREVELTDVGVSQGILVSVDADAEYEARTENPCRHVTVKEEANTAEHPALGEARMSLEVLSDASR